MGECINISLNRELDMKLSLVEGCYGGLAGVLNQAVGLRRK
jgi:hypothetical protein